MASAAPGPPAGVWTGDRDEAIEVAAAHPMARYGAVEVRPMMEDE